MGKRRAIDRPKRPDAAACARPKTVVLRHGGAGGRAAVMVARLDRRSNAYKAYRAEVAALTEHLGGNPSAVQARLIDQAARLALIEAMAWNELTTSKTLTNGGAVNAAFEPFMKAARDRRAVLQLLGIEPRTKPVPSLDQYLEAEYSDAQEDTDDN